jgi:endoglucanase
MPDNDHSPAFWESVAGTFKNDPAVVFDVFNEPFDPTDPRSGDDQDPQDQVTWNCWDTGTENGIDGGAPCDTSAYDENGVKTARYQVAGLQTLVNAIRNTGATQPVMVGGLDYANDLSQWVDHAPDDPLDQEAASFHNYMGKDCDNATCWNSEIAPVAANVPVVTGEFDEDNYEILDMRRQDTVRVRRRIHELGRSTRRQLPGMGLGGAQHWRDQRSGVQRLLPDQRPEWHPRRAERHRAV